MRDAVDQLVREGQLLAWGIPATGVLVETLLDRGADGDLPEAEAAIERLAAAPTDDGVAMRDTWLLRLRALMAGAHGDEARYREYRDRYRDMAKTLGFEGQPRNGRMPGVGSVFMVTGAVRGDQLVQSRFRPVYDQHELTSSPART